MAGGLGACRGPELHGIEQPGLCKCPVSAARRPGPGVRLRTYDLRPYDPRVVTPARLGLLLALVALTTLAGCSRTSGSEKVPSACVDGDPSTRVAALRSALAQAPGPVSFQDGTKISDCLAHDADSGDIQEVGSMLLTLTQQVMGSASGPRDGRALVELGYIEGAVHRGAAKAQGVDGEIERRIQQEMTTVDTASTAFRRGERAGRSGG